MLVLWIIIGVVVALVVIGVVARVAYGNTDAVDRVRRSDPKAARRIDEMRAEEGIRGGGMSGYGGGL